MNHPTHVEEILSVFISENFQVDRGHFTVETDLVEAGIVDSSGVVDLVGFVEKKCAIQVKDDEVTVANFGSIQRILNYLSRESSH